MKSVVCLRVRQPGNAGLLKKMAFGRDQYCSLYRELTFKNEYRAPIPLTAAPFGSIVSVLYLGPWKRQRMRRSLDSEVEKAEDGRITHSCCSKSGTYP